ncbi:MAG: hypothetical protein ACJAUH_000926 [Saprospiraceae bacterium]
MEKITEIKSLIKSLKTMNILKYSLFCIVVLFLQLTACNKKTNNSTSEASNSISKYQNIPIDTTRRLIGPCEPSIYINPLNTNEIVAGSVLNTVYTSKDGGKSWDMKKMKSSLGVFGDPVITADFQGNFYFAHLSDPDGSGWSSDNLLDRIVVQRSEDGGKTWSDGGYAGLNRPKDQDKQWLVVNPENNEIYMTWTEFDLYNSKKEEDKSRILFSKSTDKGDTWSKGVMINEFSGDCLDGDNTTEGAVPAVGANGEIYVAWSYNNKIYFDKSLDGGTTWMKKDIIAATQPGGWTFEIPGISRCNGLPITAVDRNSGTIYINWTDQRNGEKDTDVWITKSTDGGDTWSKPKRVNDDPAGKQQFLTWMSIDQTDGTVYTVFYDRRAHEDNATDVYMAYSKDGGETFINEKISAESFKPNAFNFFGDYNNISAHNGIVRPIWTRADGVRLSVWTALIDMK